MIQVHENKIFRIIKDSKVSLNGEESKKKYLTAFYSFLILSLVLELFVFNFRALESTFFKEENNIEYTVSNASKLSDGKYRSDSDTVEISVNDINTVLKNIYIGFERESAVYTKIRLWAKDEANFNGISAPEREIVEGLTQTKYIRTNFAGKTENLKISVLGLTNGEEFTLNEIKFNTHVPICFSMLRFLFVLGFMMLLYVIRPKSFIYKHEFNLKIKWQKYAVISLVIIQIIFLVALCNINPILHNPPFPHHTEYQELAKAFLNGHTYLNAEPSQQLAEVENPYDPSIRTFPIMWDHAYYNGKYYVYFGVLPALVFFLPYRLITGADFPNYLAVFICCVFICIAVFMLLNEIIKKWFSKTSFGIYMLLSIIMCDTCGLIFLAKRPDFYSIPIAMAIMLALFAVLFWLKADKTDQDGKTYLSTKQLACGSVCMALTSGCRPQFLLATFLGVVLFWNAVFKERLLFSKKSIKNTVAICLPYIIIGLAVMLYNYVRFNSPFDFGSNYNLTTNDLTHRGIHMDRNLTGLFYYLLCPLHITNIFPYVQTIYAASQYQGLTMAEPTIGGLFWLSPITVLGIRGFWRKKLYEKSSNKRPYAIMAAAVILGFFIMFADTQLAGLFTRYYSDFSWLFLLAAAIALLAEYNNLKINNRSDELFLKFFAACFAITIIIYGFHIYNEPTTMWIYECNPAFYYKSKYLIGFLI